MYLALSSSGVAHYGDIRREKVNDFINEFLDEHEELLLLVESVITDPRVSDPYLAQVG